MHGKSSWHSLCRVTAALSLGTRSLGTFGGELSVETVPVRHDPEQPGDWWLPSYFAQWRGTSMVVTDPVALRLHGDPDPSAGQPCTAVGDTHVPLRYGSPLSVIEVETLGDIGILEDPMGGDLGRVRILRASPLTAVAPIC